MICKAACRGPADCCRKSGSEVRSREIAPRIFYPRPASGWWWGEDSNLRRHSPTDLQSVPFSHSGTPPQRRANTRRQHTLHLPMQGISARGASGGIRTPDPLITNQPLYRLSYAGRNPGSRTHSRPSRAENPLPLPHKKRRSKLFTEACQVLFYLRSIPLAMQKASPILGSLSGGGFLTTFPRVVYLAAFVRGVPALGAGAPEAPFP